MSNPSNALTSAVTPPEPTASSSTPRATTRIIAYSYAPRLVYVTLAETHNGAIDIAKETFPELQDVERERISIQVDTLITKTQQSRMAEIGPTAWSIMMAMLPPSYVVEIHVAPVLSHGQAASAVEPPPYAPDKSGGSDPQTNVAPCGPQTPNAQSPPPPPSLVTRIVDRLTPMRSRCRSSS